MTKKSSNKKKSQQQQPREPLPELNIYPRRGRQVVTVIVCLVMLAIISDAVLAGGSSGGTQVLFLAFFIICLVYLLGLIWSALRLLSTRQPSFQANDDGLTLRHLPFLGYVVVPWDEIKSIQTQRSRLFAYLYIVPQDTHALVSRYGLLRFVLNASTRLSRRTSTPLAVSQALLTRPVEEVALRLQQDYGIKYSSSFEKSAK